MLLVLVEGVGLLEASIRVTLLWFSSWNSLYQLHASRASLNVVGYFVSTKLTNLQVTVAELEKQDQQRVAVALENGGNSFMVARWHRSCRHCCIASTAAATAAAAACAAAGCCCCFCYTVYYPIWWLLLINEDLSWKPATVRLWIMLSAVYAKFGDDRLWNEKSLSISQIW